MKRPSVPAKVAEPAAPYTATPPAAQAPAVPARPESEASVRYVDGPTARKLTKEIFKQHDELFRRLAQ